MPFARAYGFDNLSTTSTAGFAPTVSASNTVESTTNAGRDGGAGVRVTRGSNAGLVYWGVGNSSQPPTLLNAQMWYGLSIRFPVLPSANTVVIRIGAGTGVSGYILVNNSGELTCQIQGGTASATVATLVANTWYWLEILHDVSTTTHSIKARVNFGTDQTATRGSMTATTSRINVLGTDVAGGGTYTVDYDDLVVHSSKTTFEANRRKVVVLRPDSDISGSFTITGGDATRAAAIDDVNADDSTTYITANVTTSPGQVVGLSTYTLASGESFEGVSTYGRVGSNGTSTRNAVVALRNSAGTLGSTSTWAANVNGWQNNTTARDDASLPGGQAWNQANVDGLGVSIQGSTTAVRITQLYVYASVIVPGVTAVSVEKSLVWNLRRRIPAGPLYAEATGPSIWEEPFTYANGALGDTALWDTGIYGGANGLAVDTNRLRNNAQGTYQTNYSTAATYGDADYGFTMTTVPPVADSLFEFHFCSRTAPESGAPEPPGYICYIGNTGTNHWTELYRIDKSGNYVFLDGIYDQTWADGYKYLVRKNGRNIKVLIHNGTTWDLILEADDPYYMTGRVMFGSSDNDWRVDDFFIREIAASSIDLLWNLIGPVSSQRQLVWNVRDTVARDRALLWTVRDAAARDRTVLWNVRDAVARDRTFLWNVRDAVQKQNILLWNVRDAVAKDRSLLWNVRDAAVGDRTILWNLRDSITTTRSLIWNDRDAVAQDKDLLWHVRDAAAAERILRWTARDSVMREWSLLWTTRDSVALDRSALWDLMGAVALERDLLWNLQSRVSTERELLWSILDFVGTERTLIWDINALAGVSVVRALLWDIQNLVSADQPLLWNVRSVVSADRSVRWDIRDTLSIERALLWTALDAVSVDRDLVWAARALTDLERIVLWTTRALATAENTLLWEVKPEPASIERTLLWNVAIVAELTQTLRWDVMRRVALERILRWDLMLSADVDRVLQWTTLAAASVEGTIRYDLATLVDATRGLLWTTRDAVTSQATLVWALLDAANTEKTLRWALRAATDVDRTLRWDVLLSAVAEQTLLWEVIGESRVDVEGSLLWDTKAPVSALATLLWDLEAYAHVSRTLRWSVWIHYILAARSGMTNQPRGIIFGSDLSSGLLVPDGSPLSLDVDHQPGAFDRPNPRRK